MLDRLYFAGHAEISPFWVSLAQLVLLAVMVEASGQLTEDALRRALGDLTDAEFVVAYGAGASIPARGVKSMSERMRHSLRAYLAVLMFD
ncbi:hypothetical protein [Trinickia mobilis]|uniref:hypothetical protein n=1 Tax=Trinickia mobilis TaxID=2816356 RepID=UPI001A8D94C7|nr:hypothetical protein [Trinickia mobilis]